MNKVFRNNGLVIVFTLMFLIAWGLQIFTGWKDHCHELKEEHQQSITLVSYLHCGHFLQATFENWESEFLQMGLYVVFTVFLYQKGSSESKSMDEKEPVDREPRKRKNAPWPVLKGGWILSVYKYSLSIALFLLFFISFGLHWYGSLKNYNTEQLLKGQPTDTAIAYLGESRFWFESFQNWQSEFLSVAVIVLLSVYLRQKGSPQSKPVDASNEETGK